MVSMVPTGPGINNRQLVCSSGIRYLRDSCSFVHGDLYDGRPSHLVINIVSDYRYHSFYSSMFVITQYLMWMCRC